MATSQVQSRSTRAESRYASPGGWLLFAGFMLMTAGVMRFFDAIWAFAYKGQIPDNLQNAIFGHSLSTYGWLWLSVAVVLFVCGLGVLVRNQISRWVGVAAGALGAITAVWWLPYYPVWSLVYVGIGAAVIYALAAHGSATD